MYLLTRNFDVFFRIRDPYQWVYRIDTGIEMVVDTRVRNIRAEGLIRHERHMMVAKALSRYYSDLDGIYADASKLDLAGLCDAVFTAWESTYSNLETELALLDVSASLALIQPLSLRTLTGAQKCVDRAQVVAESIAEHHPRALKSRQYSQWVLAKITVNAYQKPVYQKPVFAPPLQEALIIEWNAIELPIYVPVQRKPLPIAVFKQSLYVDKLELALSIARQHEDYHTESMCLKQLILKSSDTSRFFGELLYLQREVQDDIYGYVRTLLAKYAFCADDECQRSLRKEIPALEDCSGLHPNVQWARFMILRALAATEDEAQKMLKEAKRFYRIGLRDIDSIMEINELVNQSKGGEPSSLEGQYSGAEIVADKPKAKAAPNLDGKDVHLMNNVTAQGDSEDDDHNGADDSLSGSIRLAD